MICPNCHGDCKITVLFVLHTDGHEEPAKRMDCYACGATGQVDDRYPEWQERGAAMKQLRMIPIYHNLRTISELLEIPVTELSRMERGLADPTPYEDAWRKVYASAPSQEQA